MASNLKLLIALSLFAFVLSKKSNIEKLDFEEKNTKTREFMNLINKYKEPLHVPSSPLSESPSVRHARHIKAVTESMLDHVINEIRQEYIKKNYNPNSPIRRLIRTLNGEMQRDQRAKLKKERKEKKLKNLMAKNKKKKTPKRKTIPKKKKAPRKKKSKSDIKVTTTLPKIIKREENQEPLLYDA